MSFDRIYTPTSTPKPSIQPVDRRSVDKSSRMGEVFVRALMSNIAPGTAQNLFRGGLLGYSTLIEFGRKLRDEWINDFAVLPGAIDSFVEVATSREWMVIGSPRQASRAVEKLHGAHWIDAYGIAHEGWDLVLKELCKDWLMVGRCAVYVPREMVGSNYRGSIQYIDATALAPIKTSGGAYWQYTDPNNYQQFNIAQRDLFFRDCVSFGATGAFLGKVFWLLPVARMEWYIREHINAKVDGRKIRDIFFVEDDSAAAALEDAMGSALALTDGSESFEKHGFPVVALNRMGLSGGTNKVADAFARLGMSEIPEALKLDEFEFRYVNEISSVLGLSLRYFWNDPRGTNRSVEQINQERQSVQGPSYFVRMIERMLNNSTIFNETPRKTRFKFEEEVDTVARDREASTFKTYLEGFQILMNIVSPPMTGVQNPLTGATEFVEPQVMNPDKLSSDSIISFLERQGLINTDITLPDMVTQEEYAIRSMGQEIETDPLDIGEVIMNSEGRILERRNFMITRP